MSAEAKLRVWLDNLLTLLHIPSLAASKLRRNFAIQIRDYRDSDIISVITHH